MVSQEEQVALEWPEPGIARLTLTQGAGLNTLTLPMIAALQGALEQLRRTPPRALIVTGSGRAFCGGAHITYFTDAASPFAGNASAIRDHYVRPILAVFDAITALPCPTIAAINGHALGGGLELALAFDFRLAAAGTKIGLPEVRLGAVAGANGVQQLCHLLGRAKALEVLLLGEHLTAQAAREIGLLTEVHAAEDLAAAALAFARRFLRLSPISLAETKRAAYRCEALSGRAAHEVALDAVHAAAGGPDWAEGMAAFKARREPAFAPLPAAPDLTE